jgi:hypothetical protein
MTSPAARPGTLKIGAIQRCGFRNQDSPGAFGHRPVLQTFERGYGAEAREQRITAPAVGKARRKDDEHARAFLRPAGAGWRVQGGLGSRRFQTRGGAPGSHSRDRAERSHKAAGDSHRRLPWPPSKPAPKQEPWRATVLPGRACQRGRTSGSAGHERPRGGIVALGGLVRYDLLQSSKTWPSKTSP